MRGLSKGETRDRVLFAVLFAGFFFGGRAVFHYGLALGSRPSEGDRFLYEGLLLCLLGWLMQGVAVFWMVFIVEATARRNRKFF